MPKIIDLPLGTTATGAQFAGTQDAVTKRFPASMLGGSSGPLARVKTASHTLELADAESIVEMDVATANTLIVPPQSAVPFVADTVLEVFQFGVGQTSIIAGANVTLLPSGGPLRARYSSASLRRRSADVWIVAGDFG